MTTKQSKTLSTLSVHQLNELYLNKNTLYGQYYGKIINIAYYSNLDSIPYAEIKSCLDPEDTKIMPLSKVVLVANVA